MLELPDWQDAQAAQAGWWGDCLNTYAEETRQIDKAELMGLRVQVQEGPHRYPVIDLAGLSVIDIGGGPVSLLLKCVDRGPLCTVLDPCPYPDWVWERYQAAHISVIQAAAELLADVDGGNFDRWHEAWVSNVLQFVRDPELVAKVARHAAPVVRVFEWIDGPLSTIHKHRLTARDLDAWFGAGTVTDIGGYPAWSGCFS